MRLPALSGLWRGDSLVRNSAYNMMTTIVSSVLGFAYWAIAAHLYSTTDVGLAAALVSAMTLAATLAAIGLGAAVIQMLPRAIDAGDWMRTAGAALLAAAVLSGIAGLVAGVLLPTIIPAVGHHSTLLVIALLVLSTVFWAIFMLLDSIYIARRETDGMLRRNAAFSAVKIPLLVLPFVVGIGALGIFGSWIAATILMDAVSIVALWRRVRGPVPRLGELAGRARQMSPAAIGHHIIDLGAILPVLALPLIVTAELTPADNAYFYATWRTGAVFFMISAAVATSMFAEGSHGMPLAGAIRRSVTVTAALLAPTAVLSVLFGATVLGLFGPEYATHGIVLFYVLLVSAIPDAITNIAVAALRVRGKLRTAGMLNTATGLSTLVLAWVLVPRYGITGAGVAWLIAQSAGSVAVCVGAGRRWLVTRTLRADTAS